MEYRDSGRRFRLDVPRFSIEAGAPIALVGPSGCGKSTMLALLALARRFDACERHEVTIGAERLDFSVTANRIDRSALMRLRRGALGYLPEHGGLLPYLTVRHNALARARIAGVERCVAERLVRDVADDLGIGTLLNAFAEDLSSGERQRAGILQVVVHRPRLVVADEPTGALHPGAADAVMSLFTRMVGEIGSALVISTHDRALASRHGFDIVEARARTETSGYLTTFARPPEAAATFPSGTAHGDDAQEGAA